MKKKLLVMAAALMLTLSVGITSFAADSGWKQQDGEWYYRNTGGTLASGWEKIGGYWYYFDTEDNSMYHGGRAYIDKNVYCFDENGHMLVNKWFQEDGHWYYFEANGAQKHGWLKSGDYWYYLDDITGEMNAESYVYDNDTWYYFDEKGHMAANKWIESVEGDWYYYKADGAQASGWEKIGGYWYYFNPEFDANTMVSDNFMKIDGVYYHFDKNGHMETNKWAYTGVHWYYYKADGREASGWEKIGNYWYYFDVKSNNHMLEDEWEDIDGITYRFDEKGHMVTGWFRDEYDDWYYYKADGTEANGWEKIGNYWYYFPTAHGNMMLTDDWVNEDDATYYVNEKGHMVTNCWVHDEFDDWYYYKADGKEVRGWYKVDDSWYYFDPARGNAMVSDCTITIDGEQYTFAASGRWVK